MVEILLIVPQNYGRYDVLKVQTNVVDTNNIPFMYGKRIPELWKSKLDIKRYLMETNVVSTRQKVNMIDKDMQSLHNSFGEEEACSSLKIRWKI